MKQLNLEEPKESQFNMAVSTLQRMDEQLRNFTISYYNKDGQSMYHSLRCLFWEVKPELDEQERSEALKLIEKCTKELNKAYTHPNYIYGYSKIVWNENLMLSLSLLREYLGDCMEAHNLLLPHKESALGTMRRR